MLSCIKWDDFQFSEVFMAKLKTILCILALIFLITAIPAIRNELPPPTKDLISEKYSGWNGVLRLWIYEGWTPGAGSLSSWINRCAASFEKKHEGVYVQPQYVDRSAMETIGENGIIMPDMILFPPALFEMPAHLLPIENDSPRPTLSRCGGWHGVGYAVPVAMGGYAWAHRLSSLPGTFEHESVSAPMNDSHHHWSAAITALCSGRYEETHKENLSLPGDMDLGLSIINETPAPSATPMPESENLLSCRLPQNFAQEAEAYTRFINNNITVLPVTQREIRRLENLSDQGKADDWRLAVSGTPFTDQISMIAVTERAGERGSRTLCEAFIDHLLSEECQAQLHRAGAFSVTDTFSGYPAYDSFNIIEEFLRREDLIAVSAFGTGWISDMDNIAGKFFSGNMDAWALMDEMRAAAE